MPVKKFRSLAHAERPLWLKPGDARIWEAARQRWVLRRALGRQPAARRVPVRIRSGEAGLRPASD